ncbi:MAG: hypothetical protein ACI92Z_001943 [Paracoccaceae bacterium]|jgi:hypothetical protein
MPDKPTPDQPAFSALSDDEMRESFELFATALASLSERIDVQNGKLAIAAQQLSGQRSDLINSICAREVGSWCVLDNDNNRRRCLCVFAD